MKIFLAVVLLAQSMDGWQRVPELQLQFEKDHAACTSASKPKPPQTQPVDGVTILRGQSSTPDTGVRPIPQVPRQPSFADCMRSKGWVKP